MFAARANRINLVNALTVVVLVVLAWSAWPSDAARLQTRAADYVEALNRGDAAASYQFLSPAVRKQMSLDAWAARPSPRREIASVVVNDAADQGVVTLSDATTLRQVPTTWVRVDRVWYHDPQVK